jgi:HD-like signal output (HDOD) protein
MTEYTTPKMDEATASELLKSVTIPPRPTLLIELSRILQSDDPAPNKLAAVIMKDVAISASMLKTVNSPFFSLSRKVGNVLQAVQILGASNVRNIVTSLILRNTLAGSAAVSLERFWDSSEKIANISRLICSILPRAPGDEAYTFGIFRDCGIPILMMRFPEYRETLKVAGGDDRPLPVVEDERHGTNHVALGYLVARSWGLSPNLCEAIRCHHDSNVLTTPDNVPPMSKTLVAVNYLAEDLYDKSRMRENVQWALVRDETLEYLGLNQEEYEELRDDVLGLSAE